jgi:hypothetical protein
LGWSLSMQTPATSAGVPTRASLASVRGGTGCFVKQLGLGAALGVGSSPLPGGQRPGRGLTAAYRDTVTGCSAVSKSTVATKAGKKLRLPTENMEGSWGKRRGPVRCEGVWAGPQQAGPGAGWACFLANQPYLSALNNSRPARSRRRPTGCVLFLGTLCLKNTR